MSAPDFRALDTARPSTTSSDDIHERESPYTVSILRGGLATRTFVRDLAEASEIIDRAEAAHQCRAAAIVDRNGRHVPRRAKGRFDIDEPDLMRELYAESPFADPVPLLECSRCGSELPGWFRNERREDARAAA